MKGRDMMFKIFMGIFMLAFMSHFVWAGVPEGLVKGTTDRVFTILKNPTLKKADKAQERKQRLGEEISVVFDFEEMSKRALGRHWRERSPEEKKEFVDLFSYILQDSYIGKIDAYTGEEVVYVGEKQDSPYATVQTKIITKTGTEIIIDYRLLDEQGKWRVYDVIIEGVSLVNNYRTQFNNILIRSSYEKLVEKLKQKKEKKEVSTK